MKALYEFFADFGRMGEVEGIFIAQKEDVQKLIDNEVEVHFGEILGKHSDVSVECKEHHFTIKSVDQEAIALLEDIFNNDSISGYNPFDYIEDGDLG